MTRWLVAVALAAGLSPTAEAISMYSQDGVTRIWGDIGARAESVEVPDSLFVDVGPVRGPGTLIVRGRELGAIVLSKIDVGGLQIFAKSVRSLTSNDDAALDGRVRAAALRVEVASLGRVRLARVETNDEFSVVCSESCSDIDVGLAGAGAISLLGANNRSTSRSNIRLRITSGRPVSRSIPLVLSLASFRAGDVDIAPLERGDYGHVHVRMRDLSIVDGRVSVAGGSGVDAVETDRIKFEGPPGVMQVDVASSVRLHAPTVAVTNSSAVGSLDFSVAPTMRWFILKNVDTKRLQVSVDVTRDEPHFDHAGWYRVSIDEIVTLPPKIVTQVAAALATDALERYAFLETIREKGVTVTGRGVERLALEAMREQRRIAIAAAPFARRATALVIYAATGYGIDVGVPVIVWVIGVIGFAIGFYRLHRAVPSRRRAWADAIATSLLASITFGAGGFDRSGWREAERAAQLARIEGFLTFVQVTLLTLFFGQTVGL